MTDRKMLSDEEMLEELTCWAGRQADKGGVWTEPCPQVATNVLGFRSDSGATAPIVMRFCHDHMQELIADGLIEEPYLDPEEFDRRYREGR